MSRIARSPASRRDVNAIWAYIAADNAAAADQFLHRIDARLAALAQYPLMGSDRSATKPGLRSVSEGNYTLFYRPIPNGIRVVRVLHASRDLSRVFPGR